MIPCDEVLIAVGQQDAPGRDLFRLDLAGHLPGLLAAGHRAAPRCFLGANPANRELLYLGISGDKAQLVPLIEGAINDRAGSTRSDDHVRERNEALNRIDFIDLASAQQAAGEIAAGLLFVDPQVHDLHQGLNTVATALNRLGERELCPGAQQLARISALLR